MSIFNNNKIDKKNQDKFYLKNSSSNLRTSISKYKNSQVSKNLKSTPKSIFQSISTKETSISKKKKENINLKSNKIKEQNIFSKSPEIRRKKKLENINNEKRKFCSSFILIKPYIPLTNEEKIEQFESIKLQSKKRLLHYGQIFKQIGEEINEINLNLNNYAKTTESRNQNSQNQKYNFKNINYNFLKNSNFNSSNSNFNSSFDSNFNSSIINIKVVNSINEINSNQNSSMIINNSFEHGDSNINPDLIEEKSNRLPIYYNNFLFNNYKFRSKYFNYNTKKFKEVFLKTQKDILDDSIIYNGSKSNIDINNNNSNCLIWCCKKNDKDNKEQCIII